MRRRLGACGLASVMAVASWFGAPSVATAAVEPPELGASTTFNAVGSATGLFTVSERALLRTDRWAGSTYSAIWDSVYGRDLDHTDAHIATSGGAAVLLIQKAGIPAYVGSPGFVATAFYSFPGMCDEIHGRLGCEPYELDYDAYSEQDESSSYWNPVYVLSPGRYWVTILADRDAVTSARLDLHGPDGDLDTVLVEPTEADFHYRFDDEAVTQGVEGSFSGDLSSLGFVMGGVTARRGTFSPGPPMSDPNKLRMRLDWPGDHWSWESERSSVSLGGHTLLGMLAGSQPGPTSVEWSWSGGIAMNYYGVGWLLNWPLQP